jgi:hypothetical protein
MIVENGREEQEREDGWEQEAKEERCNAREEERR